MKLPNLEQAVIPQAKITDYLLSDTHSVGKHKAAFFSLFGFTVESWEVFAQALLDHAAENEVTEVVETQHGSNYVIEGQLQTPIGRTPVVRSVWCIDKAATIPRLVSAYPV